MFLAFLTLVTALVISAVAIFYSVTGLAAIFSGAATSIIIMGTVLEVGKLVTASWLHWNWRQCPKLLKSYLIIATVILMLITSMGIFGYLSRAHIEQGAPIGDIQSQIEVYDMRIEAKKQEIEQATSAIKNMDEVVAQYLAKGETTKAVAAANKARKDQQKERDKMAAVIDVAQVEISKLQEEKLPLSQKVRKIETEVGPIKYIATLVYGPNPETNLLEKAVTYMILVIIFVFDPLAVLLLIASQISFAQAGFKRKEKAIAKQAAEPKVVEKTVEIIKEVPVEVIKEVEKIVEVPVEKIVEKIVEVQVPIEVIKEVEKIVEVQVPIETADSNITIDNSEEIENKKKEQYMMRTKDNQIVLPKKT
jgi:hypothetical protein